MPTVRINLEAPLALDGFSPIPANAIRTDNKEEQLVEITMAGIEPFGFFDPGQIFGQQSADLMLTHFVLSSEVALNKGSAVYVSPPNWLTTGQSLFALRPMFVQGISLDFSDGEGVMPEGSCLPIPVDHQLSFNTFGQDAGPYMIQMTFNPLPKIDQDWSLPPTLAEIIAGGGGR